MYCDTFLGVEKNKINTLTCHQQKKKLSAPISTHLKAAINPICIHGLCDSVSFIFSSFFFLLGKSLTLLLYMTVRPCLLFLFLTALNIISMALFSLLNLTKTFNFLLVYFLFVFPKNKEIFTTHLNSCLLF